MLQRRGTYFYCVYKTIYSIAIYIDVYKTVCVSVVCVCVFLDISNNKWTECQFCKMVITTVNLWRHIRTQHTPQPPRKCDVCNKNFKNKYSLREHIRISHEQKMVTVKTEN